jgi:hypothetical protein
LINSNKKRKSDFPPQQVEKKKKTETQDEKLQSPTQETITEEINQEVLVKVKKIITCPICYEEKDENIQLDCSDEFCLDCLKEFIETKKKMKKFPIECPNCKKEVAVPILKTILGKDFESFENVATKEFMETEKDIYSCCPTADCKYSFVHFEGDDPHFRCEICRKHYCLNCKCEYHFKMTCLQYKKKHLNDVLFLKFVTGNNFKQCSKCKTWIERNEGCPHMTCKCGYEFCYRCGKNYTSCSCD